MHHPVGPLSIRRPPAMEHQRLLHTYGKTLMAHRSILSGRLPIPLTRGTIQPRPIPVLPIHGAEEVPLEISSLQRRVILSKAKKKLTSVEENQQSSFETNRSTLISSLEFNHSLFKVHTTFYSFLALHFIAYLLQQIKRLCKPQNLQPNNQQIKTEIYIHHILHKLNQ